MKIFLDDLRPAPEGWAAARDFQTFQSLVNSGQPIEAISFDHDLGDSNPDGYAAVKWLAGEHPELFEPSITLTSHSANPVGRDNIEAYIDNCRRHSDLLREYKRHF